MMRRDSAALVLRFVLMIGVVNLFADMTYEGARSITGPFLGSLRASATIIGFVAGFGEFVGYALRSLSGYAADQTQAYWIVIFIGYAVKMLAVPALALAGVWPVAAAFIIAERTGRAIRRPAVETMLSQAGRSIGHGWVFGLNEALDQTGATLGPLIAAAMLTFHSSYHRTFGGLLVPAALCLATLSLARGFYPGAQMLERKPVARRKPPAFSRAYWTYVAAGALVAAGFADFSLIAFHFQKKAVVAQNMIPVFYAVAMATGALASLTFGRAWDRFGLPVLLTAFFLSALFAPLVFLGRSPFVLLGMILWGIGLGMQDSLLKAVLTHTIPTAQRGTGFGIFDTGFGIAWFLGSAAMGMLYDVSIPALIAFSVVLQLAALPVFVLAQRSSNV
jgi:predicted MFS family arabinose efflux permease